MLNVGLFGYGRIGKIHFKNIIENPKFNLLTICDKLDIEISDIHITKDENDIINNKSINAVIICSPTATHYNLIIDCLNKNKHVFVEKPLSLDVEEIKTCYNLARRKNLKLLVGYNRRFDNKILSLKNGINNIGKVNYVLTISRDYPYPTYEYLKISGGMFHDCAVHDIDYVNWILDELPNTVNVTASTTEKKSINNGNLDHINIIFTYPSNIICSMNLSRISQSYDQRCEIYGNEGELRITDYESDDKISFPERYKQSYKDELNYFEKIVTYNLQNRITLEDNVNNHIIAEACIKSFEESKKINIVY